MTTIIKTINGEVVSATDTAYHQDGTGPRDANGVLLSTREPEVLSAAQADQIKARLLGGQKATQKTDAGNGAASTPER